MVASRLMVQANEESATIGSEIDIEWIFSTMDMNFRPLSMIALRPLVSLGPIGVSSGSMLTASGEKSSFWASSNLPWRQNVTSLLAISLFVMNSGGVSAGYARLLDSLVIPASIRFRNGKFTPGALSRRNRGRPDVLDGEGLRATGPRYRTIYIMLSIALACHLVT